MNAKQIPPSLWAELQWFGETTKYWVQAQAVVEWTRFHRRPDADDIAAHLERDVKTQVARHVADNCVSVVSDKNPIGDVLRGECMAFTPEKFYELAYRIYLLGQSEGRKSSATMGDVT